MTRREEIARALSEGYPARIGDGFLIVENPDFKEDNGTDPFLVAALALPAQEPGELVKRLESAVAWVLGPSQAGKARVADTIREAASALMDQADEIEAERELSEALWRGFMTCVAGDGRPRVEIAFGDLDDAQTLHRALVNIRARSEP